MPEQDALDWDSNRSSNFLINKRLQTIVSNPLLLKSRHMMHYTAHRQCSTAEHGQRDEPTCLCPRQSSVLLFYATPTSPLEVVYSLLPKVLASTAGVLACATYLSPCDTTSPHESDP